MSGRFTFTIPCVDEELAEAFAAHLREVEEIDVDGVEGVMVLIPTGGDPVFLFGVAEMAVAGGYAHDQEAAQAVNALLTQVGSR